MKKMLMTLAAAAAIAAGTLTVSAESYWKYNDTTTIDLDETSLKKTTNGHEILNFVAIQTIPDGTCTYTYAYDRTAGTIQVVEMEDAALHQQLHTNFRQLHQSGRQSPR